MHYSKLMTDSRIFCPVVQVTTLKTIFPAAALLLLSACGTADKIAEDNIESDFASGLLQADNTLQITNINTSPRESFPASAPDSQSVPRPVTTVNPVVNSENETQKILNITLTTLRAEQDDVDSQLALGKAYTSGTSRVEKDLSQAKLWFERAAKNNNSEAQYELGKLFYTGQGTDQDYFNAQEWWEKSAELGNLDAQHRLGYLYSEGLGVEQDYTLAKLWYTKAALQGHAEAQTLLGSLYHEGNRIPTDYSEAFKWYKLAAEQGHAHAQYTLGTLYHDGLGTKVDYIRCQR